MTMRKWFPAVLTVVAFALSIAVYTRLPDHMAIHWGMDGRANGWADRPFGAFMLPGMMVGFTVLFLVLPSADLHNDDYDKFSGSYDIIAISAVGLAFAVHLITLASALGVSIPIQRVAPALIGLFLIAIGNVLPRVRANSWIGIRTPWSLSDSANWARTQRLAGHLFVASGFTWIALAALPGMWMTRVAIGSIVVAAFAAYASSVVTES
jgi:uncharacterized membrane protein